MFNFITDAIINFQKDFLLSFYFYMSTLITKTYQIALSINETKVVAEICLFTSLLGASLCGFAVCKNLIGTYGFGTQGDPDQDPFEIIFRLCVALGIIGGNSFFYTEIVRFTNHVSSDITLAFLKELSNTELEPTLKGMIESALTPCDILLDSTYVIALTLFSIAACLRGAEIILSKILLPLFAIDMISASHEKWNMFIWQYIMSFLSYIVQMLCYQMFMYQFFSNDLGAAKGFVVTIGWLVLAIRTPKWLEKYVYATGTGQAVSRGASRLGQVLMFVGMRR